MNTANQITAKLRRLADVIDTLPADCVISADVDCLGEMQVHIDLGEFYRIAPQYTTSIDREGYTHLRATINGIHFRACCRPRPANVEAIRE